MRHVYLAKSDLKKFVEALQAKYKVVGPVQKENQFVFSEIDDPDDLCMEYLPTILPPKKYFFPQKEKLGSFKMGDIEMSDMTVEVEPMVIFGAHTCDIDGLECLDAVFHHDPADPYYKKRKKSIVLLGVECMSPCDKHATCKTMDTHIPRAGYDAMFTDAGDKYLIHINSDIGEKLVGTNPVVTPTGDEVKSVLNKLRKEKDENFECSIKCNYNELQAVFKKSYNSPVWEEVGKKCVSCGNCTAVCPTCYCFDMYDDVELDMSKGERKRIWDSCQLEEFAAVAGGESFREERSQRQKHRYYRKFDYAVDKYSKFFCTGCGRCTRTCMAGINLSETINDLTKGA